MQTGTESHWISMSDMMTGLMLVFLLIAILTISHVTEQSNRQEQLIRTSREQRQLIKKYQNTKLELLKELNNTFADKKHEWDMEITDNLSIKFNNPEVNFGYLNANLTERFKHILDEFIPQYLEIITKDKYTDVIKEVRIEGHTADWDDYMFTIQLSQRRANSVLEFILNHEYFKSLPTEQKNKLKFWLTANGLGNGRMLDKNGEYVYYSQKPPSSKSRRVEFRIVTTSDELVDEIMNKFNKINTN